VHSVKWQLIVLVLVVSLLRIGLITADLLIVGRVAAAT
jgi:hypothetical protein